ncbi:AAA-like domain-containing protein [Geminocystis sp. CENA526]|uniref:AAA-like domain-containing protein n=1 Tax=Geminocystis sp. CENA526 TaxID=1355871 RepID=UPI003D6DFA57
MYQIGGSLAKDSPIYVERKADIELYEALQRGDFCYVLNSRQMGKSSLLVRTRYKLQQQGFKCTSIDLTVIGSENITPLQFYKGIIADLCRGFKLLGKFNLKNWWDNQGDLSLIQKLNFFIEDVLFVQFPTEKIFIFIDEIDSILSLPFSGDDLFAFIRFCYNQRAINPQYDRLIFAVFGVATPSDLINDRNRTPFNIGKSIELTGFNLSETKPLMKGLQLEKGNAKVIIEEILKWTNGQPFLTQKICQLLVNHSQDTVSGKLIIPSGNESFWVENIVKNKIIDKWQVNDQPQHLKTIRDRILYNQKNLGNLLEIYQQILLGKPVFINNTREQIDLMLSGLVINQNSQLLVKNKIYEEIFNLAWIERQLNRIRPYSQTLQAWIESGKQDESRLLRGKALKDAQNWCKGKSLAQLDYEYLTYSEKYDD